CIQEAGHSWPVNGLGAPLRSVEASPPLPLLTALFVLAPERDANGDEAHEKDLNGHASSPSIRCANESNGTKCSVAIIRCEEFFSGCPRKFLNAGATHQNRGGAGAAPHSSRVSRTI